MIKGTARGAISAIFGVIVAIASVNAHAQDAQPAPQQVPQAPDGPSAFACRGEALAVMQGLSTDSMREERDKRKCPFVARVRHATSRFHFAQRTNERSLRL